jgi:predicted enzyme related to lactoylglutathione lyase
VIKSHFILYVADQQRSAGFYRSVFQQDPSLNVPGMTEFEVGHDSVLGLMPEDGAKRLLGNDIFGPTEGNLIPRAELYLVVEDAAERHARALNAGARELSSMAERDWGHTAAYSLDPDGHVLAFASPTED